MAFLIFLFIIIAVAIRLGVEFAQAATFNEFLDKRVMRRTMWLWLPFYALLRLSREVIFKEK